MFLKYISFVDLHILMLPKNRESFCQVRGRPGQQPEPTSRQNPMIITPPTHISESHNQWSSFLNCIKSDNQQILRLSNCQMFGQVYLAYAHASNQTYIQNLNKNKLHILLPSISSFPLRCKVKLLLQQHSCKVETLVRSGFPWVARKSKCSGEDQHVSRRRGEKTWMNEQQSSLLSPYPARIFRIFPQPAVWRKKMQDKGRGKIRGIKWFDLFDSGKQCSGPKKWAQGGEGEKEETRSDISQVENEQNPSIDVSGLQ